MHRNWAAYLLCTILALAQTPDAQQERWNRIFASADANFNRKPNAFLLKSVEGISPGTALEIGIGQGRNTIAIARLGYDLIYAMFEQQIVTDNADKIISALKPGGTVVIEGFQEDMSKEVGRPLGHRVNELPRAFDRLRILFYEDTIGPADWNGGNPAPIVRFIARKERR